MRGKHVIKFLPFRTKIRIVYDRFTLTPLTTAFVAVALAHCTVQISLQAIAYLANTSRGHELSQILLDSNATGVHAFVQNGMLEICENSPVANEETCYTISSVGITNQDEPVVPMNHASRALQMGISLRAVNDSDLSTQCLDALNWPLMVLSNARREDVCFLVFQVWLFGISIVAVLNESIPHLVSALVTHALSTVWSVFQVSRTQRYAGLYRSLVVNNACGGVNVLSGFWAKRLNYFIPILALNMAAFIITSFVSFKLFKVYAHQTFKRVGSSDRMNTLYSYILTFSVALQLSAFFVISSSALLLDALFKGVFVKYAVNKTANRIVFIDVCIWTLPWIIIGWSSFRRERRLWTVMFFFMGAAILGAWISVFPTTLYKEIFRCFPFFAAMTVTSFVILVATLLLGVLCRMNFGKGLPQYLKNQDLIDESSFVPVFLTRRRQSTLQSVIFPDKRTSPTARYGPSKPSAVKQDFSPPNYDEPPAYDMEAPGIKSSPGNLVPDLAIGNNFATQQHGHHSFLSFLTRSRVENSSPRLSGFRTPNTEAHLIAFPERVRSPERSASLPPSSSQSQYVPLLTKSPLGGKHASTTESLRIKSNSLSLLVSPPLPTAPPLYAFPQTVQLPSLQRPSSTTSYLSVWPTLPDGKVGFPVSPKHFR